AFAGMQYRIVVDLLAQVRRGVEQEPPITVGAHRNGRLRARLRRGIAGPCPPAVGMVAVPLRITASRSGAQHSYFHRDLPQGAAASVASAGNAAPTSSMMTATSFVLYA